MHIIGEDFLIAGTEEGPAVAGLFPMGCSQGERPLPRHLAVGRCRLLCPRRRGKANDQAETNPPEQSAQGVRHHSPPFLCDRSSYSSPSPAAALRTCCLSGSLERSVPQGIVADKCDPHIIGATAQLGEREGMALAQGREATSPA